MTGPLSGIDVVILAGGYGTRMKAVLGDTPKIMADINGITLIDRHVSRLYDSGCRRIIVSCRGDQPAPVFTRTQGYGVECQFDMARIGTVGALRQCRHLIASNPVIVLNGDTWADVDFARLLDWHPMLGFLWCCSDENGKNAGVYRIKQATLNSICESEKVQLEEFCEIVLGVPSVKMQIKGYIDIGTPEGYEKAKEKIR